MNRISPEESHGQQNYESSTNTMFSSSGNQGPNQPSRNAQNGNQNGPNDPSTENPMSRPKPQATEGHDAENGNGEDARKQAQRQKIGAQWSVRLSQIEGEDKMAALEHTNLSTLSSPLDMIKEEYGSGIYVYFKYLIYLVGINSAIGLFSFIFFIIAANEGLRTEQYSGLNLLMLGAFSNDVKTKWYGMISVSMLGAFLAAPIYSRYQSYITNRLEKEQEEDERNDPNEYDMIEENLNYTERERRNRRIGSISIFFVIIVVQGFITYGIHIAFDDESEIAALVLGALVSSMKTLWKFLSKFMTRLEAHQRRRTYIEWDTAKVFFMRIANVLGVYLTKFLTEGSVTDSDETCAEAGRTADCECPLASMGQQFFWILIFELSVGNLVQVVWPWVYLKYKQRGALHSGYGDEHLKSEFDLTEEFTEVLYRQFIIYLGTTVFPLIPVMGVVSYIVEYWIDKYRLIYLCRKQLNKPSPVRARLLFGLHIFVAVAALFSFPNGTVWLFAGFDIQGKCLFWGDVN
eukprot:gb/GECG01001761.1/.p1 GENE.gb/GECG01001761.1/~~gb/GECG01001761.1/.p1  ORF type:complete len:518 (+),score=66.24 gb/GECG01001761.1/:1-1554(+)